MPQAWLQFQVHDRYGLARHQKSTKMSVPSTQTSFYESPKKPLQNPPFQKVYAARVTRSGSHSFPLQLKIVTDTQLLLPVRLPNYLNNGAVTRLPNDGIECYQYAVTPLRSRSRVYSGREQ